MSRGWGAGSRAVGFVLLRATAGAGVSLVSWQMVNLWFTHFRGRVTALSMMGLALGGLVVPPLAEAVTQTEGWRSAYLALGAGVLGIMLPVGLAFYRNRPEEHGSVRDCGRAHHTNASHPTGEALTPVPATGTIDFWYLTALTLLVNAVNTALLLDHVRAMGGAGLDRSLAIGLLSAVTSAQAIATLLTGVLVDRFGARPVGMFGLALLASSVVCVMT